jgi:hypothetical protein
MTAYGAGEIIGAIVTLVLLVLAIRVAVRGEVPLRARAVLLPIAGILLVMTVIGGLFLATGLTK